jgi:hypothetical protein
MLPVHSPKKSWNDFEQIRLIRLKILPLFLKPTSHENNQRNLSTSYRLPKF